MGKCCQQDGEHHDEVDVNNRDIMIQKLGKQQNYFSPIIEVSDRREIT